MLCNYHCTISKQLLSSDFVENNTEQKFIPVIPFILSPKFSFAKKSVLYKRRVMLEEIVQAKNSLPNKEHGI
jgi:hypothetical protein